MSDPQWLAIWTAILGGGFAACLVARALGLASTYVRDLLHVGAGVWVLGWNGWDGPALPIALVAMVAVVIALMPLAASRVALAARFQRSVSGGDERWGGLVLYTSSYAVLTAIGLTDGRFPAAAGLLSLSLGDGIGGAVGRRFGHLRYTLPWSKSKTLEGSFVVALGTGAAVAITAALFGVAVSTPALLTLAVIAAVAEALAPRGTDNLLVPFSVWAAAELLM
jgi:dolichol kinase